MERQRQQQGEVAGTLSRTTWSGIALDTSFQKPALLVWPAGDSQNALEQCERRLASLSSAVVGLCPEGVQPKLQWEIVHSRSGRFQSPALASLSGHFFPNHKPGQFPVSLVTNASSQEASSRRRRNLRSFETDWEPETPQYSAYETPAQRAEEAPDQSTADGLQDATFASDVQGEVNDTRHTLPVHSKRGRIRSRLEHLAGTAKDIDWKSVSFFLGKVLALAVVYEATSMGGKSHRVAWRGLQCACLVHASPWKVGRMPGIAAVLRPFKVSAIYTFFVCALFLATTDGSSKAGVRKKPTALFD